MNRSEMGQGVHTALAMLVAEELDVRWPGAADRGRPRPPVRQRRDVRRAACRSTRATPSRAHETRAAQAGQWIVAKIARELGINVTGGSSSVADAWDVLRLAAATARAHCSARRRCSWKLPVAELVVDDGVVSHASGQQRALRRAGDGRGRATPPGDVRAEAARGLDADRHAPRRASTSPAKSRRHGASSASTCASPACCTRRCATARCWAAAPARSTSTRRMTLPGVERVVRLGPYAGSTDARRRRRPRPAGTPSAAPTRCRSTGRRRRPAARQRGDHARRSSARRATPRRRAPASRSTAAATWRPAGAARRAASSRSTARRTWPTRRWSRSTAPRGSPTARVEVWAPTQVPGHGARDRGAVAGVAADAVTVHVTYLGGGFGRRLDVDFVGQAVRIALETGGRPVQLRLAARGRHRRTTSTARPAPRCCGPASTPTACRAALSDHQRRRRDHAALDGARPAGPRRPDRPARQDHQRGPLRPALRHRRTSTSRTSPRAAACRSASGARSAIRTTRSSPSRSSTSSPTRPGHDPVAYRLALLADTPRHAAVLKLAAEQRRLAGHGARPCPPAGRAASRCTRVSAASSRRSVEVSIVERAAAGPPRGLRRRRRHRRQPGHRRAADGRRGDLRPERRAVRPHRHRSRRGAAARTSRAIRCCGSPNRRGSRPTSCRARAARRRRRAGHAADRAGGRERAVRADRRAPARVAARPGRRARPVPGVAARGGGGRSDAGHVARHPHVARQRLAQPRRVDRLGQEVVHAGGQRLRRARRPARRPSAR